MEKFEEKDLPLSHKQQKNRISTTTFFKYSIKYLSIPLNKKYLFYLLF